MNYKKAKLQLSFFNGKSEKSDMKNQWLFKIFSAFLIVMLALAALPARPASAFTVTFSTPGTTTWTVPAGVTSVTVEVWGGGGRGGSVGGGLTTGAGGGGGGGAYSRSVLTVTPGATYTVVVGAGSTGAGPGGDSYFGSATTVMAKGGNSSTSAAGATGGAAASGFGDVRFSGGNGADGSGTSYGGGGGSSAGTAANGNNATTSTGATAPTGGGDGGNGRTTSSGGGSSGSAPGGGGGGALKTSPGLGQTGGPGAAGRVVITYVINTTLTVSAASGTYGDTVNLSATLSPAVAGKTINFTLNGTSVGSAVTNASGVASLSSVSLAGINAGVYPGGAGSGVGASFAGDTDYGASSGTATLTVNQRPASVTPNPASKTYGDADPAFTGTLTGFLPADGVTATYSRTAGETVAGSPYTISATLSPAGVLGNYNITYNTADFTITQRAASVTPDPASKTYGDADPAFTGTLTGFLPADGVTATYSRTAGETVAGSPYTISATLSPAGVLGNYNITYNTANFTINPATITPSINASNKVYDGTTGASFTCSLSGVIGSDDVNCAGGTANFDNKNVGTGKTVTATGLGLGGADAGNYQLSSTTATDTADITVRTLNVTATGVNKVYDGTTDAAVILNDDRVGGDDLTVTYTSASFLDPNVGVGKTVNVSGISISGGADAGNYTLGNTTATTTADITIASQTITVTQNAPTSAANGSTFNVAATASSGLPVTITTSGSCSGGDTDGDATITMTSGTGVCSVFYNQAGNTNYSAAPQVQEDVNATESPVFTSPNNVTFDVGFVGSFTVTAVGNPLTMTITQTGALPSGVTFTDNGNGTATLSGAPAVGSHGVYNLTFTANNGVPPNGVQNFTLTVKTGPVIGANGVGSNPDTGDGSISENEVIVSTLGITQLTVQFSQDVYDPAGDTDPDDVTNPANYLLVRGSASGTFSTVSCAAGLTAPDVAISVDSVTYSNGGGSGPFIATLNINGGFPLNVAGFYRLFVCGTTSIVDAVNTGLALAGDGVNPGTDFVRNFRLQDPVVGGGGGGGGVTRTAAVIPSGVLIPVTGFAPNAVTALPAQPAENAYAASGLKLVIPSLSLDLPIVGVKLNENGWDVTWLNGSAGYLEGSAYPTWKGNTVLTGHVTDANGKPGPFAYLKELAHGDKVYIYNNGFIYVYQAQQNGLLAPNNVKALFKSEEYDWLTLVTCEDYDPSARQFKYRRMVRATLISVIPAK